MLIELLSQSNYQSFNVNMAHLLGLHSSIYLGLVIELNEKAIRKNKVVNGKYFVVDREYVYNRTTLKSDEQYTIEDTLVDMGIINRCNDGISVNLNVLTELVISVDETLNADLDRIKKLANKSTKNESILKNVKRNIKPHYPEELRTAYEEWLDVMNHKFNFVSKQMLESAETLVDNYANKNLDTALAVIKIAQANGWKDMQYAIKRHKETSRMTTINATKNDSVQVMTGVEF